MQLGYAAGEGPYRPGACNIGPQEIARRRRGAIMGFGVTALIAIALVALAAPPLARLVVFPFLAGSIISAEQWRRHFCVGFAMAGIRNFGRREEVEHIEDAAARAADRRAALIIVAYSSVIAAVITLGFVLLPV